MHQGQREAALGSRRLQERQMRLERDIRMSRSIDAALQHRRNEPQVLWNVPEQDYVRNLDSENPLREGTRPSPASLETLMNVSMHMLGT
jgi:hypothetical protein